MSRQATLTVEVGAHRGKVYALEDNGTFLIGRDKSCELSIPSGTVTRNHCRVEGRRGAFSITDLNSRHGTFVNGDKIKSRPLRPGDIVMVGGARLRFDMAETDERKEEAPAPVSSPRQHDASPPSASSGQPAKKPAAPAAARPAAARGEKASPRPAPEPKEEDLVPLHIVEPDSERGVFVFSERDLSFRGEKFAEIELLEPVGKGRRCLVYKAADHKRQREIAIKVVRPKWINSQEVHEWFARGARRSAQMHHENLVPVFGGGRSRGTLFLALELMEQNAFQHFRHAANAGLASVRQALQAATVVCRALEFGCLQKQRLHGGVRPSKILFTFDGEPKLSGLGFNNRPSGPGIKREATLEPYIPPEVLREGDSRDIRGDIYSLGATFFYMLTGRAPVADNRGRILSPQQFNKDVPDSIVRIVEKMTAIPLEERYESHAHLMHDLRWALRGEVWRRA